MNLNPCLISVFVYYPTFRTLKSTFGAIFPNLINFAAYFGLLEPDQQRKHPEKKPSGFFYVAHWASFGVSFTVSDLLNLNFVLVKQIRVRNLLQVS